MEEFAAGKAKLTEEQLKKLAKSLYPHREYDAALGLMRSANRKPPTPTAGARPERFIPAAPVAVNLHGEGARVTGVVATSSKKETPGWVSE